MTLDGFRKIPHDYIGDGAYIGDMGFAYIIITTNGVTIQNEISIEKESIKALNNFVASREDA